MQRPNGSACRSNYFVKFNNLHEALLPVYVEPASSTKWKTSAAGSSYLDSSYRAYVSADVQISSPKTSETLSSLGSYFGGKSTTYNPQQNGLKTNSVAPSYEMIEQTLK